MDLTRSLPPELWDHITENLDCLSAAWLYLTSKTMSQVLENGGLTCLSHVGNMMPRADFKRIESFCSRIRKLKYLQLGAKPLRLISDTACKVDDLKRLPKGLRSLNIVFEPSISESNDVFRLFSDGLERLSWSMGKLLEMQVEMSLMPASLTSFAMHSGSSAKFLQNGSLQVIFPAQLLHLNVGWLEKSLLELSTLPKHLLSFTAFCFASSPLKLIENLPKDLTYLSIPSWKLTSDMIALLPPNLTFLDSSWSVSLSVDDIPLLPPSLTDFVSVTHLLQTAFWIWKEPRTSEVFGTKVVTWNVDALGFQSKRVHELSTNAMDGSFEFISTNGDGFYKFSDMLFNSSSLRFLPPKLHTLVVGSFPEEIFGSSTPNSPITPSCFPETLTRLEVMRSWRDELMAILPSSITHLQIPGCIRSREAMQAIPPKLRILKILPHPLEGEVYTNGGAGRAYTSLPDQAAFHFPHLYNKSTDTSSVRAPASSSVSILPPLPSSLTHFSNGFLPDQFDLSYLPHASMKELRLDHAKKQPLLKEWTQLTSLLLPKESFIKDSDLNLLSPLLQRLELNWNTKITEIGIKMLPPGLTILNLCWNEKAINDDSSSFLPRSLVSLNINCSSLLTAKGIAQLPPNLTKLYWDRAYHISSPLTSSSLPKSLTLLTLNQINPKSSSFLEALPRSITHLELQTLQHIDSSHFSLLPPSLLHLDLRLCSSFSPDDLILLPRSITQLDLSAARQITKSHLWKLPPAPSLKLHPSTLDNQQAQILLGPYRHCYIGKWAKRDTYQ
jgi:hypothetical protein